MNFGQISHLRSEMRREWQRRRPDANVRAARTPTDPDSLEEGLLPDEAVISIQDDGHGMSLDQLRTKFLVAGRRRRLDEGGVRSPGNRVLMGRKGVGKLAGFGVARVIEVVSKVANERHACGVRLDFDAIMGVTDSSDVRVPTFRLDDDANLGDQGTRVTFTRLVNESVKSREETVRRSIGDHFFLIDPREFAVCLNGVSVEPAARTLVYAWPEREDLGVHELVKQSVSVQETDQEVEFEYRLRFVQDRAALRASERGVRVYAHKRLAAAPSLLHADTNMHGFRMTDYLDGVLYADFIDEHRRDYIATDGRGCGGKRRCYSPCTSSSASRSRRLARTTSGCGTKRRRERSRRTPTPRTLSTPRSCPLGRRNSPSRFVPSSPASTPRGRNGGLQGARRATGWGHREGEDFHGDIEDRGTGESSPSGSHG